LDLAIRGREWQEGISQAEKVRFAIDDLHPHVGIDIDSNIPNDFTFEYTASDGDVELSITGMTDPGRFFACEQLGPLNGPPMRLAAGETIGPDLLWLSNKDSSYARRAESGDIYPSSAILLST